MLADPLLSVLDANRRFYEVFRLGDFLQMDLIWSRSETVSVHHPFGTGIRGRADVMASWYEIMVELDPPAIYPCNETVILNGSKAIVWCMEQFGSQEVTASNVFAFEAGGWRLMHHQAVPLPARFRAEHRR
ncbi:MAG: nuclear transport factor 2 family protein [Hyphomicrobiaceae bacterium]